MEEKKKLVNKSYMNVSKNCQCCLQSYEPYTIGKDSEVFYEQSIIPVRDTNGEIIKPIGLCAFCNPKSTVWYTPKMKCHNTK